jgi:hypothetical protein
VAGGDRHVHDALDAGSCRSLEQRATVRHGRVVVDLAVREAHPVRVVQSVCAAQGAGEFDRIVEVQWAHVDLASRPGAP